MGPDESTAKPKIEGRTLVVGLEQVGKPHCKARNSGYFQSIYDECDNPDYSYRNFFYAMDNNDAEVVSLCKSWLVDYFETPLSSPAAEEEFERPTWPRGEWKISLFGQQYTYRSDGQTSSGLWKPDGTKVDCDGDNKQHGKCFAVLLLRWANCPKTRSQTSGVLTP